MMRRFVSLFAVSLLVVSLAASSAADGWRVTAGAFWPTGGPEGADTGYAVGVSLPFHRGDRVDVRGAMRYVRYGVANGSDIELWRPSIDIRWRLQDRPEVTIGPIVGAVFGHNTGGGNTFSIGWGAAAGIEWDRASIEVAWLLGAKSGEQGVALSAGWRF